MASPTVTSLTADLAALAARVTALEEWRVAHEASMAARKAQVSALAGANAQLRRVVDQARGIWR